MNLFNPRTFSTDWEIMVLDRLNRVVGEDKLAGFAAQLTSESDVTVQLDWRTLEFAMGINHSFEQLWTRIQHVTDRAAELLHEWNLDLFPAGSHPHEPMFNANHIHVGTLRDEAAGIQLEAQLLRTVPAFAALAANSPLSMGRRGQWKSYRVHHRAHGCTQPIFTRDPQFAQGTWGFDAGVKLQNKPTLEVRICDCASSRRFLAELATLVAAWVHHSGTKVEQSPVTPRDYDNYLINRWTAARDGLQATFHAGDQTVPVVEVLSGVIEECSESLKALGMLRDDFVVINAMLQKRVAQADFVHELMARYPDDYQFTSAWSKLARHWTVFEEWLEKAASLEPIAAPDEAEIEEIHLNEIGEGTHFYRSREAMFLPPPTVDTILQRLVERGDVQREEIPNRGTLLNRRR